MSDQPQVNLNDDDELSVDELESAAGGIISPVEDDGTNVNGCGGNCNCSD